MTINAICNYIDNDAGYFSKLIGDRTTLFFVISQINGVLLGLVFLAIWRIKALQDYPMILIMWSCLGESLALYYSWMLYEICDLKLYLILSYSLF